MAKKVETILVKGTFEQLGAIDLFPYSDAATQITRRNDECNKLVFSAEGFEFHRNFVDGEPMQETKVIILDDFVSTGLSNSELDKVGEKVGIVHRFQGDRLSYYVGDYEIWSPFEPLKGFSNFAITYDRLGDYYRPIVLELTESNRISKTIPLDLYSSDLYSLRYYIAKNRVEVTEYAKERKYSLSTYIAGFGEQEKEYRSQKMNGIYTSMPTE